MKCSFEYLCGVLHTRLTSDQ